MYFQYGIMEYYEFLCGIHVSEVHVDQIGRMRLFVRVVETGSFSRAAKAEGVVQSTASKEMSALEKHIGGTLVRRNSRGLTITEQGQEFYDFSVGMLADLDAAEDRIRSGQTSPRGRLRVTCPAVFSSRLIVPNLPDFFQRYPDLSIDLQVSERYLNLVGDGIDVAIRIGNLADSSLLSRQIGSVTAVVVASPGYLERYGKPRGLEDLQHHACLPFMFQGNSKTWKFEVDGSPVEIVPSAALRTNDADAVHTAVRAGLGLAQGPRWIFCDDIDAGTLVPLLTAYAPQPFPIQAVHSGTRRMNGAIKAFVDFVAELTRAELNLRMA